MEEWKTIDGYPGLSISSQGRVWSSLKGPGRILRAAMDQHGYPIVSLWHRERHAGTSRRVHLLVAEAFLGPCPDGQEVRHLDGDPAHCEVSNLAYGTRSTNMLDAVTHGTHVQARKTHCDNGHPFTPENTYIRSDRPNRRECRACRRAATARSHARRHTRGESNSLV